MWRQRSPHPTIRSALDYDLASKNGEPGGEWVAGNLTGSGREMARQAGLFRQLRPDCKRAIWSCSLSLPPSDGRRTAENWAEITTAFFKKMGIDERKHAWAAHRHTHTNDHIHIRLCRVGSDGVLWNQEHSAKRAIKACAELEVEFDLNKHDRTPAPKTRPSRAETEISIRKGKPMSREKIQELVNKILADHPTGIDFDEFQKLLLEQKIEVQAYAPGGVLKGVSYAFDSLKWPGSKIGREFSAGLPERGVRYQQVKADAGQQVNDPFLTQQTPPVELKRTLPARPPQHQIARVSASPAEQEMPIKKMGFELDQIADLQIGPLSKVMLYVGGVVANLSFAALRLIYDFIRNILARFGFGMRPAQSFASAPAAQAQLMHEPFPIEAETRQVTQSDVDEAARQVFLVAEAVSQKDPNLLPAGEGRAELVEALTKENATGQATVNFKAESEILDSEKSELDELFSAETADRNEPEIDELEALKIAVEAQKQAEIAVETAPKLDAHEVVAARQSLSRASQKLREARAKYQAEKQQKPKFLQFAFPAEKDALSVEIAAEAAAKAALADSISKHPSKPPAELIAGLVRARLTTAQIAKLVADEALKSASLNADPEVKKLALSKANSLLAQTELFAKFPTVAQANIVLNAAESGQLLVAAKRDEVADLARLEVQRALQIRAPQELDSEDAPR